MKRIEILGMVAGSCTTASFIPQVYTVWSMKPMPAVSISLWMYVIFLFGVIGWAIYGIKIRSYSMIIMNCITAVLAISILAYKFLYG